METAKELYQQMESISTEIDRFQRQLDALRDHYRHLKNEMSSIIAQEIYGLKVGDVVNYTDRKKKTIRVRIAKFSAFGPDDDRPSVEGYVIKKDGTISQVRKVMYPSLGDKIPKVEQDQ